MPCLCLSTTDSGSISAVENDKISSFVWQSSIPSCMWAMLSYPLISQWTFTFFPLFLGCLEECFHKDESEGNSSTCGFLCFAYTRNTRICRKCAGCSFRFFRGASLLFSIMAFPVYILPTTCKDFLFLHVLDKAYGSSCILLNLNIQFSQDHLLDGMFFSNTTFLTPLSKSVVSL